MGTGGAELGNGNGRDVRGIYVGTELGNNKESKEFFFLVILVSFVSRRTHLFPYKSSIPLSAENAPIFSLEESYEKK